MYRVYVEYGTEGQAIDHFTFSSKSEAQEFIGRAELEVYRANLFTFRMKHLPSSDVDGALRSLNIVINS